jgi:hypothetical protein
MIIIDPIRIGPIPMYRAPKTRGIIPKSYLAEGIGLYEN